MVTIYNNKEFFKVIAVGNLHYRQQNEVDKPLTPRLWRHHHYLLADERIETTKNAKRERQQDYFTGDRIDFTT